MMRIVIVGAVAGGASAAARARRLDERAEIILFERGPDPSFANCGMPYYVGGVIEQRDKLLVAPERLLRERLRLDVRTRTEVMSIDRDAKTVQVRNLATGEEYTQPFDKLILAPGAAPLRPPLPGIDLPGIMTLRNLQDMDRIKQRVDQGITSAVVIGAGFIGLEMAENLVHRKVPTTLVELQKQIMPPLDAEMAVPILDALTSNGVDVRLGVSAQAFEQAGDRIVVKLSDGVEIETDLVVLSIGVKPESGLAERAGLALGVRGSIKVDSHMRTSDWDIYAVGDAIETTDPVLGGPALVPLAGPANRQGRIAADHIYGRDSKFRGAQGTAVVGLFGMTAAMTGASEKRLRQAVTPYEKIYIHPGNHAGYYPGARGMALKLLFDPETGRVLGAQAVGGEGVDKRIDVIAMAIQAGMTVEDLEEVELSYAPQFGSAKDPVNMAGFVAAGVLRGDHPIVHAESVMSGDDATAIIDVRGENEFASGGLPGAVNIPLESLRERLDDARTLADAKDGSLIVNCAVGMRGYLATRILMQEGFNVRNLSGGYKTWKMVEDAREAAGE